MDNILHRQHWKGFHKYWKKEKSLLVYPYLLRYLHALSKWPPVHACWCLTHDNKCCGASSTTDLDLMLKRSEATEAVETAHEDLKAQKIQLLTNSNWKVVNSPAPSLITNLWNQSWSVDERVIIGVVFSRQRLNSIWQATHRFNADSRLKSTQAVSQTFFKFTTVKFCVVMSFPA